MTSNTVTLDANEASILAVLAKQYVIDNDAELTENNKFYWNLLITKLAAL